MTIEYKECLQTKSQYQEIGRQCKQQKRKRELEKKRQIIFHLKLVACIYLARRVNNFQTYHASITKYIYYRYILRDVHGFCVNKKLLFGESYLLDKKCSGADFTVQFKTSSVRLFCASRNASFCRRVVCLCSGEDFKVRLFCASRDENLFHRSHANLVRKNKP